MKLNNILIKVTSHGLCVFKNILNIFWSNVEIQFVNFKEVSVYFQYIFIANTF